MGRNTKGYYIKLPNRGGAPRGISSPESRFGKKDGKMVMPGTRVFMSFAAAQRLSEALTGILEKAHRDGEMEQYTAGRTEREISTKVRQKRQTKST